MDLLDNISQHLNPKTIGAISRQIGADEETTQKAIAATLPVMVGALSRNANRSAEGAESLTRALEKDHDGRLIDNLGSLLTGGPQRVSNAPDAAGAMNFDNASSSLTLGGVLGGLLGGGGAGTNASGILGHIFGSRRGAVERGIGQATGLDQQKVMQLMLLLAPIVMSALGKMRAEKGLGPDGVAEALRREEEAVAGETGQAGTKAAGKGLLDFLDRDDDGSIVDDVAKIGAALGGSKLFDRLSGRR